MTHPTDQVFISPNSESAAGSEILSAGQLLRAARLRAGVHLAFLSVTLKVPVRQLEALEANELDPSKGPVFYRALAASLCRHLQIDPAPVLALLPVSSRPLTPLRADGIVALPERRLHLPGPTTRRWRPSRVVWAAAFMLLLTGALLWLPGPSQWLWLDDVTALLGESGSDTPLEDRLTANPAGGVVVTDVPAGGAVLGQPQPLSLPVLPAIAAPDVSAQAATMPASAPPAQVTTQAAEWVFTAREESWLELRNAQKNVVWSGVLQPGLSTRIASPVPVSVVVGRAPVVTATWRGQPFDLKPYTQVTVARFEVKE